MKKIYIIICLCFFTLLNFARANDTRMGTLMAGDYIDDLIYITVYPHQIGLYHNNLWGDITENNVEDYGIIITPDIKYGALAIWEPGLSDARFNIGYGISIFNFDVGAFVSPVEEHTQFGFGLGRSFFTRRFDLSFIVNDEVGVEWYQFNLRLSKRKADFIIVPKYQLNYYREPYDYTNHRIGLMLQRLILNEGFVFFIAEYDFSRGDIQSKYTKFYVGLELPLNRIFIMRLGVSEVFTDGFENPQWCVEPGISLKIREFSLDFHLNKDRLFDKDVTIVKSFGLDLNFGRF